MGGGGSASKTAKGGEWNVNDFNLTGTEKQIKYARDLIQRQYDGLLAGEKEYRRKADEYRKKGREDLAASYNKQADSLYGYAAKWANTELKRLARKNSYKAGDVINTLTDGYGRNKTPEFDLFLRWTEGESSKYFRTHKTKYSKKKK